MILLTSMLKRSCLQGACKMCNISSRVVLHDTVTKYSCIPAKWNGVSVRVRPDVLYHIVVPIYDEMIITLVVYQLF